MAKKRAYKVRNAQAVRANFAGLNKDLRAAVIAVMEAHGLETLQKVVDRVPRDLGFMAENTRITFTPQRLAYSFGWYAEDFIRSVSGQFYPPYVEGGTRVMPARPTLVPVHTEMVPKTRAAVAEAINREVRKRSAR